MNNDMTTPKVMMFERDSDQSDAPVDTTAYVFRWWYQVFADTPIVSRLSLFALGVPRFECSHGGTYRDPEFIGEISRIYIAHDAHVDPDVFKIEAQPLPKPLLERDPDQFNVPLGYVAYTYRWRHSIIEYARIIDVQRRGLYLRFTFEEKGPERPLRERSETSRLFIRDGAVTADHTYLLASQEPSTDTPGFRPYDYRGVSGWNLGTPDERITEDQW